MTPRGLVAQGADNTGAAATWGGPVDFVNLAQGIALTRAENAIAREKQRLDAEAKRREKFQGLDYNPAWDRSHGQFQQEVTQMNNAFHELGGFEGNFDDPTSKQGRLMQDAQKRLNVLADMDSRHKEMYFEAIKQYNEDPTQFEPDFYQKLDEFDKLQTIEDRDQFIRKNNFLQKRWDPHDMLQTLVVGTTDVDWANPEASGGKTYVAEKDIRDKHNAYLLTPQGKEDFAQGVKRGTWKTTEEMFQWVKQNVQSSADKAQNYTRKEQDNEGGGWGSGNTFNNGTVVASGSVQPGGQDNQNAKSAGGISVEKRGTTLKRINLSTAKTGKEIPPIYLETKGGEKVFTQVTGIEKENGQWVLKGRKVKELNATEAKSMGYDMSTIDSDGNTTFFKALENVSLDYDRNASALKGKTGGFDAYQFEREYNENFKKQAEAAVTSSEQQYFEKTVLNFDNNSDDAVAAREIALQKAGARNIRIASMSRPEVIKDLEEKIEKLKKVGKDTSAYEKQLKNLKSEKPKMIYQFKLPNGASVSYDTSDPIDAAQLADFIKAARQ